MSGNLVLKNYLSFSKTFPMFNQLITDCHKFNAKALCWGNFSLIVSLPVITIEQITVLVLQVTLISVFKIQCDIIKFSWLKHLKVLKQPVSVIIYIHPAIV